MRISTVFSAGRRFGFVAIVMALLMLVQSCETPEKVLKSNDVDYKLKKATYWYNKKEYFKCIPLFEELMGVMKGRSSTEDIYYMYCMANYRQGDFMISAYHFKNFTNLYPLSPKAEECSFMHGKSNERLSPKYELDQTYTYKAIDAYQEFINSYPESARVDSANRLIMKLRKKLEKKAMVNAELYYKTQNYRAAATCFENLLVQYPDIDNVERILFMVVKSNHKFAENSIVTKKVERYHNVINAYNIFRYKYPQSQYDAEVKSYATDAHFKAVTSAYEHAEASFPWEKEGYFNLAIKEAERQKEFIADPKSQKKVQQIIEKSYYGIVRNNFEQAEEFDTDSLRKVTKKIELYDRTVKSYYNFVDKYKDSRYIREAERLYTTSTEKIAKFKNDGQKQKN
ncbi:MAG: outer membrane protein assembly factor BamD [Chitinophagales bacterium]